jgi:thiol-disulfide isomerase/thioredoxin
MKRLVALVLLAFLALFLWSLVSNPTGKNALEKKTENIKAEVKEAVQAKEVVRPEKTHPALKENKIKTSEVEVISHGKTVVLNKFLVRGYVVIVDFYADWCGPCRSMAPSLEELAGKYDDVIIRKIDIVNWGSKVAQQFGINSIPDVRVYDKKGQLVGQPTSDFIEVSANVDIARSR